MQIVNCIIIRKLIYTKACTLSKIYLVFPLLKKWSGNVAGYLGPQMEIPSQIESIHKNASFAPTSHVQECVVWSARNVKFSP